MKKKLQIFVSSTYTDLKEERQAAVEAILKSGNIPAGMELFTAGNESQLETITRWIDDSDIYFLILGGRYGSIEPKTGKSYTELEYDYAVTNKKPLFAVVISDTYLDEKIKSEGKDVLETDNSQKYKEFKEKVLAHTSQFFDSPKDIKLAIHETLHDFKDRYEFIGWIPGDLELKYAELIETNEKLRKEIDELRKEAKQKNSKKNQKIEVEYDDFSEIYKKYNSLEAKFTAEGKNYSLTINEIIKVHYSTMITGITNQYGMSDMEKILFFSIMPQMNLHGLAELESIPRVGYRRFSLTPKGKKYALFLQSQNNQKK